MAPAQAAGQTSFILAGHLGSSPAAPGGVMVDVGTEVQHGLLGLRVGAGMDAAGTAIAPVVSEGESSSGVWSSDVDAGLNLGRVPLLAAVLGRSNPAVFLGAGVAGISEADDVTGERSTSLVPTWSYGARGGVPVTSWLGLELEARHRDTFGEVSPESYPGGGGWEYRAGIALRFGGGRSPRVVPVPRRGDRPGESRPAETGRRGSGPVATDTRRSESAEEVAERTLRTAEQYLGTRYRWGGTSPSEGFDCSGFVLYVFRQHGIALPRVSRDQARAGEPRPTSLDGLARGDLLFFAQGGPTVDHVAIYAGDGRIIHSSSSGSGVRYDDLSGNRGRWYVQHLVAVRRVIGGDRVVQDYAAAADDMDRATRELPLDEAFEALLTERGDAAPAPDR